VKNHSHSKPLEINADDEKEVARWFEGKLDFPVDPPKFAPDANVRLIGARISRSKAKDAAQLVYDVGGHKVTFMIFDPGKDVKALDSETVDRTFKHIPNTDGWVMTHRGYSVGVYTRRGIAYTMAADVGEGDALKLLSSISY
jgi:anti-sigma factor RsiW